ncbi:phosphotransferase [Streptomyces sp. AK02-01A]|uniref:phosphotransferase n=1 Tax=Streptomyces sp. AK02-01A TaxID=3028648 RepID=UPI0029B41902|nr:phosphotransferase [Streptomyces sp. AK02-01A]MDX3853662.1 phosphotransferase [Streptomyces sp. AK02-01A]
MPLRPRFVVDESARRLFVDRTHALAAVEAELDAVQARVGGGGDVMSPRVLNVTGVGGIGKSRLLAEVQRRAEHRGYRTAALDLQVPRLREQDAALSVLRAQFGEQKVRFDRYDLAYAALWQRWNPNLRLSEKNLPFLTRSEVLGGILDGVTSLPVFATAIGLIRAVDSTSHHVRHWQRIRTDPVLQRLDSLPNAELADAVTYLFAEELRAATSDRRPYILFVDAHEALGAGALRAGRDSTVDAWLRDLVSQLDAGLVVVASREPLRWARMDVEWDQVIRLIALDGLPMADRLSLLEQAGVETDAVRDALARASAGVPFYLHLAIDTVRQQAPTGSPDSPPSTPAVSTQEILRRFLQHVSTEHVQILELLSVARTFDRDVFRKITAAFGLPGHQLAWEGITAYSFVHASGQDRFRLHQLMVQALRDQLSPSAARAVNRVLRAVWQRRADALDDGEGTARHLADSLREAAFHAARAEELSGPQLLSFADRITRCGSPQSTSGLLADLREYVGAPVVGHGTGFGAAAGQAELRRAALCADADLSLLAGEVERAAQLTEGVSPRTPTEVEGRLALVGAHARRILGSTSRALELYTELWQCQQGAVRLQAGLWAADLHMAQGRFAQARELADSLRQECPPEDHEFLGDAARLLHLAHRFAFDFEGAAACLEEAEQHYRSGRSAVGLANIAVNRVELLAWTDPARALGIAQEAVATQVELGAKPEIGKAYSAMALACLGIGEPHRSRAALELARENLRQAGYRSGLARAELVRAVLLARTERIGDALTSARRAVAEFEATEVYPSLVLATDHVLRMVGLVDDAVSAAADAARAKIQPFDSIQRLDQDIETSMHTLLADASTVSTPPGRLYAEALSAPRPAAGFYNRNVRLDTSSGPVMVRIPISHADQMDLRIWPEHLVTAAVGPFLSGQVPRLLYRSAEPAFQVYEFVDGAVIDDAYPKETRVPDAVPGDVVRLLRRLTDVPREAMPDLPDSWPRDGDTSGFGRLLQSVTAGVIDRFQDSHAALFSELGIPTAPLETVTDQWDALARRPFRLVHSDIHRKNMILRDGAVSFLDWELALWGDPVYELAVHLHKMGYQTDEAEAVVRDWSRDMPTPLINGWQPDLDAYLRHERIKSAVVDSVRYAQIIAQGSRTAEAEETLVSSLTKKLNRAGQIWGWNRPVTASGVRAVLDGPSNPGV